MSPLTAQAPLLLLVVALAAAVLCSRGAHAVDVQAVLRANNITLWQDVLRMAGIKNEVQAGPARYAVFVPTDDAVRAFLRSMDLTMAGLAARPALAKQLAGQHLVLALSPEAQRDLLEGRVAAVDTAGAAAGAVNTSLAVRLLRGAGAAGGAQVAVRDARGQEAASLKVVRLDPSKLAVIVDRVLLSRHQYTSLRALCEDRGPPAAPMCEALARSGVVPDLGSPGFDGTVFFPSAGAFASAGIQPARSSAQALAALVRYHVLPGRHAIPGGFVSGDTYATLLKDAPPLRVVYASAPAPAGSQNRTAFVIPADGQRVPVVVFNMFVGKGIVQGIPSVLLPPGVSRAALQGGDAPKTQQSGGRRRLLGFPEEKKVTMPFNSVETAIRDQVRTAFREQEERWR